MNLNIVLENGINLELNQNTNTAKISFSIKAKGDILIPNYVENKSRKYIITCIKEESFRDNKAIKSITFTKESSLKTIEKNAFSNSLIESINSIPPSCDSLEEGCFLDAMKLTHISISQQNLHYNYLDNEKKLILHKTSKNNELFFAITNVKKVFIPSTITKIGSFAFFKCEKLRSIEFPKDSKLETIEKCAFLSSSIGSIVIPKSVTQIKEYSFSDTKFLRKIEFDDDSDLRAIGQCAFSKSSLVNFCVPKKVQKIAECAFSMCQSLISVEFLGDDMLCEKFCFYLCYRLYLVSFPNCKKVPIQINKHDEVHKNFSLFICAGSEID